MSYKVGDRIRWTREASKEFSGKRAIVVSHEDEGHLRVRLLDAIGERNEAVGQVRRASIYLIELDGPRERFTSNEPGDFPKREVAS